ncbi:hypothetical protein [Rhodopirellula baltica]|uniref:Uncharacterized protein n=1 Tax=Rhodopirellula baltica SWK14 TaxID=993516 RepID=L7CGZ6_RHOBT|nr:hypothetical protein [Rhodopirellula baltica]ELP32346.1 hypothetical protein RBSWK_03727 [Rhodopirellula baltica SWK14]
MITSSDREYKSTKRIKQGKKRLRSPFDELSEWIASTRKVTVLNVVYNRANSLRAPRLQIILEHHSHAQKFHRGVNFDSRQQNAIKKKFLNIIEREGKHDFDVDGLFVVFSAFSPIAKEEADSQITEADIKSLQKRIGNPDLWEISRCFGCVTFFFFTDKQMKKYEAQGKKVEYASMYFEILKPHDEFGYLKRNQFKVYFDSKQNFDEKYESNWFYYYH